MFGDFHFRRLLVPALFGLGRANPFLHRHRRPSGLAGIVCSGVDGNREMSGKGPICGWMRIRVKRDIRGRSWHTFVQVLTRLFPVGRGLFEDKVANIWCIVDVLLKLRAKLARSSLCLLATGTTLCLLSPLSLLLLRQGRAPVSTQR